ncbi:MAG: hypothetical protein OXI72_19545 [Gemmatimonadota bacterium]|nr:hypothetical protein [Gemmatimonadota bacterium]
MFEGVNPYDYLMEQHPANAVRMSALLIGLREINYDKRRDLGFAFTMGIIHVTKSILFNYIGAFKGGS